jgi:microcystin-dependent protein
MEQYLGQLLLVGFQFAPQGWAFCNGQILQISQNNTLYSLLGTTYGGDGVTTFGLPNLQGLTPIGTGQLSGGGNYALGQVGGAEQVTIGLVQYPSHSHGIQCSQTATGGGNQVGGAALGSGQQIYVDSSVALAAALNPLACTFSPGGADCTS